MKTTLFDSQFIKDSEALIANAEKRTSCEFKIHFEDFFQGDLMDRASYVFIQLGMQKTRLRNGVLIFISLERKQLAILGDIGFKPILSQSDWIFYSDEMINQFKKQQYLIGLEHFFTSFTEKIKDHFPWEENDINELDNAISGRQI